MGYGVLVFGVQCLGFRGTCPSLWIIKGVAVGDTGLAILSQKQAKQPEEHESRQC